jgi:RNA polymerase sigma-70 factor (ECF subfamily)
VVPSHLHNDKALFKQISAGDEKAFRAIFDLYKVEMFRAVIRLTKSQVIAEEIIQEVFIGLWISRQHLIKVEEPALTSTAILFNRIGKLFKERS